jgi:hypothetical protein
VARLEDYRFGRVTVDGSEQTRDLIVLPDRVVTDRWRREGHSLAIEDLHEVLDKLPQRLILGVGAYGRLHPTRTRSQRLGGGCVPMRPSAATRGLMSAAPRPRST